MTFTIICSSVDEAGKEKLAPFSALSGDESYQSRDLEKVHLEAKLLEKCFFFIPVLPQIILSWPQLIRIWEFLDNKQQSHFPPNMLVNHTCKKICT